MNNYFVITKILILLIIGGNALSAFAGEKDCQQRRADKLLEEKYRLEPRSPPVPKYPAPFNNNTPYGKISPSALFRNLAGNYCDSLNNLPTIYASGSGLNAKLTVVGPGFERSYPLMDYQRAFTDYLKMINDSGYQLNK